MKLYEQQAAFAYDVAQLIEYIFKSGYSCTLGEAFRTQEQAQLYAKQNKGIINSLHCQRLAIDLNLFTADGTYLTDTRYYVKFGEYWESLDTQNRWGGNFKERVDGNHFERRLE